MINLLALVFCNGYDYTLKFNIRARHAVECCSCRHDQNIYKPWLVKSDKINKQNFMFFDGAYKILQQSTLTHCTEITGYNIGTVT